MKALVAVGLKVRTQKDKAGANWFSLLWGRGGVPPIFKINLPTGTNLTKMRSPTSVSEGQLNFNYPSQVCPEACLLDPLKLSG